MSDTFFESMTESEVGRRLFEQERAILEMTELILERMQEAGVSRSQLAERLGKSKSFISQILDGSANMTLRTVSDLFSALGRRIRFSVEDVSESSDAHQVWDSLASPVFCNEALWAKVRWPTEMTTFAERGTPADAELAG